MNSNFPPTLDQALEELAKEYHLIIRRNTHYEAINRELWQFHGHWLYRLNLNFDGTEANVSVTSYIDKFPVFLAKLLILFHNIIPGFPYCARISWRREGTLPLGLRENEYRDKLRSYIENCLRKKQGK